MTKNDKSHHDYIDDIGRNFTTPGNRRDRNWNRYYYLSNRRAAQRMLAGCGREAILDLGTSNGGWYPAIQAWGFEKIYGVELHPQRAEQARGAGYDEVYNCDGAETPLPENSLDAVLSNGVFVHIIRIEDKIRVLQKVEEILKPGGSIVFNHPPTRAYGIEGDYGLRTQNSFMSPDFLIKTVHENTGLVLTDVYPTYFHWRRNQPAGLVKFLRKRITWNVTPRLLELFDRLVSVHVCPIDESDSIYYRFTKPQAPDE